MKVVVILSCCLQRVPFPVGKAETLSLSNAGARMCPSCAPLLHKEFSVVFGGVESHPQGLAVPWVCKYPDLALALAFAVLSLGLAVLLVGSFSFCNSSHLSNHFGVVSLRLYCSDLRVNLDFTSGALIRPKVFFLLHCGPVLYWQKTMFGRSWWGRISQG